MNLRPSTIFLLLATVALAWAASVACGGSGSDERRVIVAAGTHTCSLVDGAVHCWGNNYYGQVGSGDVTEDYSINAETVDLGERAIDVAAGYDHTCAATESGKIYCWGRNKFGQLGAETRRSFSSLPVEVEGLTGVVAVGAGDHHSCAILENGGLRCWGANSSGTLGNGKTLPIRVGEIDYEVQKVGGLRDVVQVDGSWTRTCALTGVGEVYCWGQNANGQLGDGTHFDQLRPAQVMGLPAPATAIAVGGGHTCALIEDGRMFCWGSNHYGELGDGTSSLDIEPDGSYVVSPQEVLGIDGDVKLISASSQGHTCAVTSSETVYCWGFNENGQVGAIESSRCVTIRCQLSPIIVEHVPDVGTLIALSAGSSHTCALFSDGTGTCWGANSLGQLGDGTDIDSLEPVTVLEAALEEIS